MAEALPSRDTTSVQAAFATLVEELTYLDDAGRELVRSAFAVAFQAHAGQKRASGEPYIHHPIEVARILGSLHLDAETLAAGLLHDVVEDSPVTLDDLEQRFGKTVRAIVEGETKISSLSIQNYSERQNEYLRQIFLSIISDIRVIIVKLADRLHNMRTLAALPPPKQQRIAKETLEIYAPLAHRLGMAQIKWELEDLSFYYLEPEAYQELSRRLMSRRREREDYIRRAIEILSRELQGEGIQFDISGRPKHLYSVHQKMIRQGKGFDEIFDLLALRVLVDTEAQCYQVLGMVHKLWPSIPGRFKDYISNPKPNGYQSLHTTVIWEGDPLEVQIRTHDMHRTAEYGVAAHWLYKEHGGGQKELLKHMRWLERLKELGMENLDSLDFVETAKSEIFGTRVFVFTPRGEILDLPEGATPVDFAYRIHTDIGHHCVGARVNRKMVPLTTKLKTGDLIEILTNKSSPGPSQDWLQSVVTRSAKSKIRAFFSKRDRFERLASAQDTLERALRRANLPLKLLRSPELEQVAAELVNGSVEDLLMALTEDRVSVQKILEKLQPPAGAPPAPPEVKPAPKRRNGQYGIFVEGLGGAELRLAGCCSPVRPDPITGYITRGRGVTVHRTNCPNMAQLMKDPERCVSASWDVSAQDKFLVDLHVISSDRTGLLRDIMTVVSGQGASATKVESVVQRLGRVRTSMRVEVKDQAEIESIIKALHTVPSVDRVYRVKPN